MTFIDDFTRYTHVSLLRNQSEALESFKHCKLEVRSQLGKKIKILRTDRGGELLSNKFNATCISYGITHQTTSPYSPKQNGVAERKIRPLMKMVNSMINSSGSPMNLWGGKPF